MDGGNMGEGLAGVNQSCRMVAEVDDEERCVGGGGRREGGAR
jgi:hypothetical protein